MLKVERHHKPLAPRGPMVASLLLASLLAGACISNPEEVEMNFVNTSEVSLCFHPSSASGRVGEIADAMDVAVGGRMCAEVKPRAASTQLTGCGYGAAARTNLVTVRLTAGPGGTNIYERTAPCFEWQDAHATFIIKRTDGELRVTDSLVDDTQSR